jgi:hypothetical protein
MWKVIAGSILPACLMFRQMAGSILKLRFPVCWMVGLKGG